MKPIQIGQLAFVLAAAVAVYSFVATARDSEQRRACGALCHLGPSYAAKNRLAPDFELERVGGGKVKLSDHRGKVVIMNFWSKVCAPCLQEMPALADLASRLEGDAGVVVITVSTDESVEDVSDTLRSVLGAEPSFLALVDPEAKVVTERYGTKLYPETWFIDPEGVIRARFDGVRDWQSPMIVDLAHALRGGPACSIAFEEGRAVGPGSGLCEDV